MYYSQVEINALFTHPDDLVLAHSMFGQLHRHAKTAVLSAVFTRGIKPEDLDAARFNLKAGAVVVAGAAAFDIATNTATFTPSAALAPGTAYTWTIGPGLRGDADSPMQNAYVVTFTTAP